MYKAYPQPGMADHGGHQDKCFCKTHHHLSCLVLVVLMCKPELSDHPDNAPSPGTQAADNPFTEEGVTQMTDRWDRSDRGRVDKNLQQILEQSSL